MHFTKVLPLMLAALAAATPIDMEEMSSFNESLVDRAICPVSTTWETQILGDGVPHQNFIFKQVSGTTDCSNDPEGGASVTATYSVDWSASIGFAGEFITGGFAVGESISTGYTQSFGCKTNTGTIVGDLCVFERIQITAFTAQTRECTTDAYGEYACSPWEVGIIYAPNTGQGSCYYDNYQTLLPCGPVNSEHYIKSGPAGGPSYIACEPVLGPVVK